ncbi:MAG: peptidoglycan DD-metalloendopeptidase family protein [Deltaproteobacteria bacterium]|nr:peptidoglycan DD-metalloendopeptidase family protein [Deltaproteobacteria bacterium]MBW2417106.1 peptidoglycan DD-metalloendopeptidase family protein [Deltaproteobacteria bacterium]
MFGAALVAGFVAAPEAAEVIALYRSGAVGRFDPIAIDELPVHQASDGSGAIAESATPVVEAPPVVASVQPPAVPSAQPPAVSPARPRPVSIALRPPVSSAPPPSFGASADRMAGLSVVTRGKLVRGQSLGAALGAQGISPRIVHLVAQETRSHLDLRRSQPGDVYRLTQSPDGKVESFRYWNSPDESIHLFWDGSVYAVRREQAQLEPRLTRVTGVVEGSLYQSILSRGEDPLLANDFADIFAWDIDFTRNVQPGDGFEFVYERLYRTEDDGEEIYVRAGRIRAAHYSGAVGDYTAVYFESGEQQRGGYYRPDGTSVERAFLVAPLEFSRISSNYSAARPHPILKVTRPHHGIDYAAKEGTPLWSVADGTVIFRGRSGGFGNLIKIRHANGYVSYYAHLARFAKDLSVGTKVVQREVIGYVGKTGLATGPHVCFRVAKNGRYVNPFRMKSPAGNSVNDETWADFESVRDSLLVDLHGPALASVEEAL